MEINGIYIGKVVGEADVHKYILKSVRDWWYSCGRKVGGNRTKICSHHAVLIQILGTQLYKLSDAERGEVTSSLLGMDQIESRAKAALDRLGDSDYECDQWLLG